MSMRIKITFGNDTRVWRTTKVPPQFVELDQFILKQWGRVFSDEQDRVVQYKDDEGDLISITDQQDLEDAIQMAKELGCKSLKLVIQVADRPQRYPQSAYAHSVRSEIGPYVPKLPVHDPLPKRRRTADATPGAAADDGKADVDQTMNCPGKCGLTKFRTQHHRYNCDVCGQRRPRGSVMFGCRTCDYDVCESCAGNGDAMVDDDAEAAAPACGPKRGHCGRGKRRGGGCGKRRGGGCGKRRGGCSKKQTAGAADCPMKAAAKDFLAQANDKDSELAKELDVAVDILFSSLQAGESVQVAMDTILASCDTIREHQLFQIARPFIYGYVEKMQRMAPMLLSLGPDVVKNIIPQLLKAAHEMMNNKGDVYVDMAPFIRKCCPGVVEAMEATMKNGAEMDIDLGSLFNFGGCGGAGAPPAAVELTDTDGDTIRFAVEDGGLVEYCNGKKELDVSWIKVNEYTGVIHDAGGRFTIQKAEREEKLRALHKLCQSAEVKYIVAGRRRFHHDEEDDDATPRGPRWGGGRGRWGGCGGGRGRWGGHRHRHGWGGGAHHGGRHGGRHGHGHGHHWRKHAQKWASHCAQKAGDGQNWADWGKKMQQFGAHMAANKDHFAKMGQQWARNFVPKDMQKPPKPDFNMKFIAHENIQQRSTFMPGQVLMKSWRLLNTGARDWVNCELIFVKGDSQLLMADTQRFPVGVVKVDEEGVATAMINTPDKPGRYKAVFRLQKLGPNKSANGQRFGGQLFIDINVVATQEELEEALIRQSREQAEKDRIRRLRADMQEKKMKARQEIQAARKTFRATKQARKAEIDQAKAAFDAERRISNAKRQQMNVSGRIAMLDAKMQKASLKPKKQANLERRRQALQDKLAQIEAEIAAAQSGDDADLDGLYSDDGSDPTAAVANPDDSKDGGCDDAPAAADADDLSDVFEPTAGDLVVDGPRFDDAAPGAAEEEEEDAPLIPQPAAPAKQGSPAQSHDSFELVDAPMVDAQEPALPTAPPADFYPHQNQLDALMGMGFGDEDMARFALDATGGDLDQSVAMILQQMGHSA